MGIAHDFGNLHMPSISLWKPPSAPPGRFPTPSRHWCYGAGGSARQAQSHRRSSPEASADGAVPQISWFSWFPWFLLKHFPKYHPFGFHDFLSPMMSPNGWCSPHVPKTSWLIWLLGHMTSGYRNSSTRSPLWHGVQMAGSVGNSNRLLRREPFSRNRTQPAQQESPLGSFFSTVKK